MRLLFGGNLYTHNPLSHVPPIRTGATTFVYLAKHGRVVVLVDCTNLLNPRHIHSEDNNRAWRFPYDNHDDDDDDMIEFDTVVRYCGLGIR